MLASTLRRILFALVLSSLALPAVAAEASSGVKEILEGGWAIGPDSLDKARKARAAFIGSAADHGALDTAFGLVLIKHHKYEEATTLFESLSTSHPDNQVAWRALIWLYSLQKKSESALLKIDQMSDAIRPTEGDDAIEEETLSTARFLGRMFAYMDGPASSEVSRGVRKLVGDKIEKLMVGARAQEFKTNYDEVTAEFASLTDEGDQARDQAKEDQQMAKEQERQDLVNLRERLEIDQAQAQEKIDGLRSEFTKEQAAFNQMELPLSDAISRLELQLSVVRREILNLTDDLNRLQSQIDETNDPRRKEELRREMARAEILLGQYQRDNQLILAEGNRLAQRRDAVRASRAEMTRRYEADIKETQDWKANLVRREKRTDLEEKRISRPSKGNTPRVREMGAKATSLRTYADFPLELERHKLLTAAP
ncbi:hypothetical protein [Blastopirellula marina]|uniref:Tetratricopeptide repeat-like domain-containing protein n=1 Tax=Blastopirellula marina TaxID=124 RepID=A0A2S8GIX3_9BACT|nr:hypothetical protein [Blastopirellula marina]PQO44389.1 hypothetical protein C5Y93_20745 [Blastopirellula marina]